MYLFVMIACNFLFFLSQLQSHVFFVMIVCKRFFFPLLHNCSNACGHKYHVLGITDMSKVFFSNF